MSPSKRSTSLVSPTAGAWLLLLAAPVAAYAQGGFRWPDHPKNIKALPAGLTEFDFASDEKPAKAKARLMIRMVQNLNQTQLAGLAELGVPDSRRIQVGCVTCHRGLSRPVMLDDVLVAMIDSAGVEAAVEGYQDLRKRYYGGFQYDFSPGVLTRPGERLSRDGKHPAAIRIIQLELATNGEDVRALAPERAKPMIQRQIDRLKNP